MFKGRNGLNTAVAEVLSPKCLVRLGSGLAGQQDAVRSVGLIT
jgi:hypothetical protein